MVAGIAYLRALREARGLGQEDVASDVGVSHKTVWNWENYKYEPTGSALAAFINVVQGSAEHVVRLLNDQNATEDDGRALAQSWLSEEQHQRVEDMIETYGGDRIRAAVEVLRNLPPDQLVDALIDLQTKHRQRHS